MPIRAQLLSQQDYLILCFYMNMFQEMFVAAFLSRFLKAKQSFSPQIQRTIEVSLWARLFQIFLNTVFLTSFKFFLKALINNFGFKPGIGCSHAIYAMTKTVKYYTDRGSNVHICALDLSKAFDKIDPSLLFTKPINRNCPKKLIKILQS